MIGDAGASFFSVATWDWKAS